MSKSDSSIRAEGAEVFVRSVLMLEYGVITSLASRNMPDYDVIAHNLRKRIDCKISVKYRMASNSDGFRFKRVRDFDFFVGVLGRRGKIGDSHSRSMQSTEMLAECYILTRREVATNVRRSSGYLLLPRNKKVLTSKRKNAWARILRYLKVTK